MTALGDWRRRFSPILLFLVLKLTTAEPIAQAAPPQTDDGTIAAAAEGIRLHRQKIRSLYVNLRQNRTPGISSIRMGKPWYDQTVAFKGVQRYTEHKYPLDPAAMPEFRFAETWDVWNGEVCVSRRLAGVVIIDKKINDINNNSYFDMIFYAHTDQQLQDLDKTDYWLPNALLNFSGQYRVVGAENIEGCRCLVIERPGRDKLWLDTSRRYLLIRREFTWGEGKPLRERTTNRKHREMEPALWLPMEQEQQVYCEPEMGPDFWNKVDFTKKNVVSTVQINQVPDTQFHLDIPPGCIVTDKIRGKTYFTQTAKDDPWETSLRRARSLGKLSKPSRLWLRFWFWSFLAMLGLALMRRVYRAIPPSQKGANG